MARLVFFIAMAMIHLWQSIIGLLDGSGRKNEICGHMRAMPILKTILQIFETLITYEPHVAEVVRKKVRKGGCVIDLGANQGQFTSLALWKVGSNGLVVAVEPHPEYFKELSRRVSNHANVVLINAAISDKAGLADFFMSKDRTGADSLYRSKVPDSDRSIKVILVTLNKLIEDLSVKKIDLLKMDIEGAELAALKGGANALSKAKYLVIEVHYSLGTDEDQQIRCLLTNYGFYVRELLPPQRKRMRERFYLYAER